MKKSSLIIAVFLLLVGPLVSAHPSYYEHSHAYAGPNYYKDTVIVEEKHVSNTYSGWTKEKRTTTSRTKEELETWDYYPYHDNKGFTTVYRKGVDNGCSHWRCKEDYSSNDYEKDSYTRPYYYEPRYDWHLGMYNWRY